MTRSTTDSFLEHIDNLETKIGEFRIAFQSGESFVALFDLFVIDDTFPFQMDFVVDDKINS